MWTTGMAYDTPSFLSETQASLTHRSPWLPLSNGTNQMLTHYRRGLVVLSSLVWNLYNRLLYNSVFGDHVPMILANALNVDLILIEESDEGLLTIETVQSNQDSRPTPLFLHKRPDYYNAIVPLSIFLLNPCDNAAMHMLTIPLTLTMLLINPTLYYLIYHH